MDDIRANPAPLGLMGFGMTTVLLNIINAGFFGTDATILSMGIFYGGVAQVIAGILEYRKGNTFGVVAFTSYGLFWLSLVYILQNPPADLGFVGWYLFMWGIFTAYMFIGTLPKNRALQTVFGTLAVLFFLLAIAHWTTGDMADTFKKIAGWEGIVCGFSAIYLAAAEVLNDAHGKTILPIGVVSRS